MSIMTQPPLQIYPTFPRPVISCNLAVFPQPPPFPPLFNKNMVIIPHNHNLIHIKKQSNPTKL